MLKITLQDVNNSEFEDGKSELDNDMNEQEECMENIQMSDQDSEDEEKKSSDDEGND